MGTHEILQNVSAGQLRISTTLENSSTFKKISALMQAQGFEIGFEATYTGKPVKGIVYILNMPFDGNSGVLIPTIVIGPEKVFKKTLDAYEFIGNNYKQNPQFQQQLQIAQQNAQQQMTYDHQQRMANNQAQFDAHQQRMQNMSQANDTRNDQWLNNHLNTGWNSGSSTETGYTSHEAFLDAMRETSTFQDPYSGQQVQQDGVYQYNYTNGLGKFYGTNDPNFNPNTLQGDWQKIEPLKIGDK
jgi:hypothetical protein